MGEQTLVLLFVILFVMTPSSTGSHISSSSALAQSQSNLSCLYHGVSQLYNNYRNNRLNVSEVDLGLETGFPNNVPTLLSNFSGQVVDYLKNHRCFTQKMRSEESLFQDSTDFTSSFDDVIAKYNISIYLLTKNQTTSYSDGCENIQWSNMNLTNRQWRGLSVLYRIKESLVAMLSYIASHIAT